MYLGARPETRIMYINSLNYGSVVYATEGETGFPVADAIKDSRTSLYIPKNLFKVVSTNKTFKYNIGAGNVTVTLDEGTYTASALASHIDTKLGGSFVFEYEQVSGLFKINNTSVGYTLITSTDLPFWDMIGFVYVTDTTYLSSTVYYANRIRRNTGFELKYDLGGSADCSFFALLGERNKTFSLTSQAIVNLRLSNIDDYASSEININVTPTIDGCFTFIDSLNPLPYYRYVWITIIDRENPSENVIFSQLFLGGYVAWYNRTINNGFGIQYTDRSLRVESVSGALFFEKYPKYPYITGLTLAYLRKDQLDLLQQTWFDLGKSQHFYLSLDSGHLNGDLSQLTWYGVFDSDPQINNVAPRYYNASFTFRGD